MSDKKKDSEIDNDDSVFSGNWQTDPLAAVKGEETYDCGPNNNWSGPMVLHFSADGKSFSGNYGKCSSGQRSFSSISSGSTWNGKLMSGSIDC